VFWAGFVYVDFAVFFVDFRVQNLEAFWANRLGFFDCLRFYSPLTVVTLYSNVLMFLVYEGFQTFQKVKRVATSDAARRVLHELGLTEYETDTYLALLRSGALTASEVSEQSNVPYSKIYEVLNALDKKGWIEVEHGRPSKYFPKSPIEALSMAKLEFQEKLHNWEKTIATELQPIFEHREIREKPDIWILRGELNVLAKLQEMVDNVKTEAMIAAPVFTKPFAGVFLDSLRGLHNRNVQVLFMAAGNQKDWNLTEFSLVAEVRTRAKMFGGGVICDGKEALLMLGEDKPSLVIWSNHVGLVKFARDYFQYLWDSSKRVDVSK
jgi:sugar-specific transcriptional regulator TrmB